MMCVVVVEERMLGRGKDDSALGRGKDCVVEPRRTGDAVVRMMIVEERMIGRGGKDDVRLIIEKMMSGREEIGLMIVRVVKHGTLLICMRPGNGTGSASDRHDCQS